MHFCSNPIGNSHGPLRVQFRKKTCGTENVLHVIAHRKIDHFNLTLLQIRSCQEGGEGGLQKINSVKMINYPVGNAYCQ
jgi:hypothetical protein